MERKLACPHCGGALQVNVMVVEPGAGARARWADATEEERAEQGRRMAAGRKLKVGSAGSKELRGSGLEAEGGGGIRRAESLPAPEIRSPSPASAGCARHPHKADPKCAWCSLDG